MFPPQDPNDFSAPVPSADLMGAPPEASTIARDTPAPEAGRAELVTEWAAKAKEARQFWEGNAFKRMRRDMAFCAGRQWQDTRPGDEHFVDAEEERYVANITLRHVATRTASIYGKNPKIVARRKPRLLSTVWDGSAQTFQAAIMQTQEMAAAGLPVPPQIQMLVEDAMQTMAENKRLDKIGETLQLLFEHEIDEQPVPFKVQMKSLVRRGLTVAVGYTKLGYQRVMERRPEIDTQISTYEQQLASVERISADIHDGETQDDSAEAERLRLEIAALSKEAEIVVREGLTFTYPHSTAILPDPACQTLRGFVGCDWVAEEYFLTPDRIKEIYRKDVTSGGSNGNSSAPREYRRDNLQNFTSANDGHAPQGGNRKSTQAAYHCVWEIYCKTDGMVYVVCDGHPDFLVEPSAPDVYLERFYPWFPFIVNETYDEKSVVPPSDVALMRDQQLELNRSRQGLAEHRRASRPKTYAQKGALSAEDKSRIAEGVANEVIELDGILPGQKIQDVLQDYAGPQINPALYDASNTYEDYLRTLGQQEANLGGTSGSTATEASIAEGSRVSAVSSVVDDLDEFLTELARAAGQVLLLECSEEKVKAVVGPGAVWPDLTREAVAREIFLEVEAASTGRPNKAQEVQNAQAVFPLLMQIPGLSPEWMARELLRRMDDRLDVTDAFAAGAPSIMMANSPTGGGTAPGEAGSDPTSAPGAQGGQGGNNAPATQPPQVNAAPRPPSAPPTQPGLPV